MNDTGREIALHYASRGGYGDPVIQIRIPKADFEEPFRDHVGRCTGDLMNGTDGVEIDHVGRLVSGEVVAVFRWGVILDLGLSRPGLIDALYIDDEDQYEIGQVVEVHLDEFDERKEKFIARPPHQTSLVERLRAKGFEV